MNGARHAAISQMLVETAETLAQPPRTALAAGELLWGAACHGLAAVERHPDDPHRQPSTRRELLQVIDRLTIGRGMQHYLRDGLRSTQRRLHDNFYTGRLSDDELAYEIRASVDFVRYLLQIAGQQQLLPGDAPTA